MQRPRWPRSAGGARPRALSGSRPLEAGNSRAGALLNPPLAAVRRSRQVPLRRTAGLPPWKALSDLAWHPSRGRHQLPAASKFAQHPGGGAQPLGGVAEHFWPTVRGPEWLGSPNAASRSGESEPGRVVNEARPRQDLLGHDLKEAPVVPLAWGWGVPLGRVLVGIGLGYEAGQLR